MSMPDGFLRVALEMTLKATVLLGMAATLDRLVLPRRAAAAARHLLWSLTFGTLLLLPLAAALGPRLGVPLPMLPASGAVDDPMAGRMDRVVRPADGPRRQTTFMRSEAPSQPLRAIGATQVPAGDARGPRNVPWGALLVVVYALGVLLRLAGLIAEQRVVRHLERTATPVPDGDWRRLLRSLVEELELIRPITILRGTATTMPLTWGTRRPAILLPSTADEWTTSRRRAVLLHELAHVARHDCLTQTLAAVACAMYWPHPGIWWAARRLREYRELACDDQALLGGVDAREYARHLLDIARTCRAPMAVHSLAVSMAAPSHLETRLRAIIDTGRRRRQPSRRVRAVSAVVTASALVLVAAVRGDGAAALASPTTNLATSLTTSLAVPEPRPTPVALGGAWTLRLATPSEPNRGAETLHLALRTPGLTTAYVPLAAFVGLAPQQLASASVDVRFELRRDPGTFSFEGNFHGGRGSGRFVFSPDTVFAATLVRRGLDRPTPDQQFALAQHEMSVAFLDELAAQGYPTPTTASLLRAAASGADLAYLREMGQRGRRFRTLDALVSAANNGDGDGSPPATPAAAAPTAPSPPRSTPASTEIVSPANGSTPLTGRWLVSGAGRAAVRLELQWTDGTQWRRDIALADLRGMAASRLSGPTPAAVDFSIEQDAGRFEFDGTAASGQGSGQFRFVPDRGFAAVLRSLGVRDVGAVSDHQLKNLAFGGMSAKAIRELAALGFTELALGDVTDLAVRIVAPEYVRALQAAQVSGIGVREVTDLRLHGVPAEFAAELSGLGYGNLTARDLDELWSASVTPDFVRSVLAGRAPGDRAPTLDELVQQSRQRRTRGAR